MKAFYDGQLSGMNILIVDDTPRNLDVLGHMLTKGNLNLSVSPNGEKALEVIEKNKPDLILLDVMMPNVDGPTALGQLRQVPELISIPVIFITAKVMKEEVAEFRELGAVDIIEKPFDPQSLTEKINEIWESTQK